MNNIGPILNTEGGGHFFDFSKRLVYKSLEPPNFFFDMFCPSVSEEVAEERRCATCHKYFSQKALLVEHRKSKVLYKKISYKNNIHIWQVCHVRVLLRLPLQRIDSLTGSEGEVSEQEDIDEINIVADNIEMPILDENDPDLAVFEDLWVFNVFTDVFLKY